MTPPTDTPVKVAIVGCGNIGPNHARAYAATGKTELVGVADIDTAKAAAFAQKFGSTAYPRVEELLAEQEPSIVSVATPPGTHAELALAVLAAGHIGC